MWRGWDKILYFAKKFNIFLKLSGIFSKKPNATHEPGQTMKTMFKGFLQNIRIYRFKQR
jgi:hypothetical protein